MANRSTVHPLGVTLSFSLGKLDKVACAVGGREQLHVSSIGVREFGCLGGLEANADSLANDGGINSRATVVCAREGPGLRKCTNGAESQQQQEFVHFFDQFLLANGTPERARGIFRR